MTGTIGQTSLVPAVKRLLVEYLQAAPELRDPKVEVLYSKSLEPFRECIYLGGSLIDYAPGPMGGARQKRDEVTQIACYIVTAPPGKTSDTAEARAFELLAVLENLLAANPTLDGALPEMGIANGLQVAQAQAGDADPNVEGWEGFIRVTLTYSARLT